MIGKEGSQVTRWLLIIFIVIASLVVSGAMLEAMGVIDLSSWFVARFESHPAIQPHAAIYRLGLRAEEAIAEALAAVEAKDLEIQEMRAAVEQEWARIEEEWRRIEHARLELDQRARQLDVYKESLDARAARLDDLERLQATYNNMRATDLVPILAELEDGTVARILAGMDDRKVAQVFAAMDPERAARLSRILGGISAK